MKLERISLPAVGDGDDGGVVDLAPGLTVVEAAPGGEGRVVDVLVGALSTAQDGVHVELALDTGTGLVAFRPAGAIHRMIALDSGDDLSARHRRVGGGIDVLAPWRQADPPLERDLTVVGSELVESDAVDDWVTQLAGLDPDRLLSAAEVQVEAERGLRRATAAARSASERPAAPVATRRTDSGPSLVELTRRHRRLRAATFAIGALVPVATLIGLDTAGTAAGIGLMAATLAVAALCFIGERRLQLAIDTEEAAARRAARPVEPPTPAAEPPQRAPRSAEDGSPTATASDVEASRSGPKGSTHPGEPASATHAGEPAPTTHAGEPAAAATNGHDRVAGGHGLGGDDGARLTGSSPEEPPVHTDGPSRAAAQSPQVTDAQTALAAAAARYQAAAASWHQLAGTVPASWVLAHGDRIRATAELRAAIPAGTALPDVTAGPAGRTSLAAALVNRAAANRLRAGGEALPLFLVDPLAGLSWEEKAPVLELAGRLAALQQLVLVTADSEVLAWARLEAMTGAVGVVTAPPPSQPAASHDGEQPAATAPGAHP